MSRKVKWGILGAGIVVDRWIKGALQHDDMEIVAISSRTKETAEKMAAKWNIPNAMSYDEMLACPEIEIVYIPVPHTAHKELALKAMNAGKHVLVEKPATVNAAEFQELIDCAKKNNVFMMEAVWTRFFPIIKKAIEYVKSGKIGEVRTIESTFSFRVGDGDTSRLTDPERAGGGLLDTGVYNLHLAQMIYEKSPVNLLGVASIDTDENHYQIDEQAAYIGQYDRGELSVLMSGVRTETIHIAYIYGTKGYLVIPMFWKPTTMEACIDGKTEVFEEPVPQKVDGIEDEGYQFEIAYVNDCVREGVKESPFVPWEASLSVMKQMDKLRKDWNLVFPNEK